MAEMRTSIADTKIFLESLKIAQSNTQGQVQDLYTRSKNHDERIDVLRVENLRLEQTKAERNDYEEHKKLFEVVVREMRQVVAETEDHCKSLDMYIDKYQAVTV